jgi:hypothetical protein
LTGDTQTAPIHYRGGTISAVLVIAYLIQGIVSLLLGAAAADWGLKVAIDLGSVAIALLGGVTVWLAILRRRATKGTIGASAAPVVPRNTFVLSPKSDYCPKNRTIRYESSDHQ